MEPTLASHDIVLDSGFSSSRLEEIETSDGLRLSRDYRKTARLRHLQEWEATDQALSAIYGASKPERLIRFRECRHYAWFVRGVLTGTVKVKSNACHHRWCPICSSSKSEAITAELIEWCKTIEHLKFVTLTLRSSDLPLSEQLDKLYHGFQKLRKRKEWLTHARGSVWFFQVTRNGNTGLWHPHLHILADMDYWPKGTLSDEWMATTGDSCIVDIKSVDDVEGKAKYCARYVARPAFLQYYDNCVRVELVESLHGRRLHGTTGSGKRVRLSNPVVREVEVFDSIGSWSHVIECYNSVPNAMLIAEAWRNGWSLPAGVTFHYDQYIERRYVPLTSYDAPPD